jgi:hypothetical protein
VEAQERVARQRATDSEAEAARVTRLQAEVARVVERKARKAESAGFLEGELESEEKRKGRRHGQRIATQTGKVDGEAVKDDCVNKSLQLTVQ